MSPHWLPHVRHIWIGDKLFGSVIPECIIARPEAASDPKAEGRRICVELMREFREIPGVSGVHIMAPLNEAVVPEVIAEFRKGISGGGCCPWGYPTRSVMLSPAAAAFRDQSGDLPEHPQPVVHILS